MLEEYSKNNEFVTVTKKRRNMAMRRKAKSQSAFSGVRCAPDSPTALTQTAENV